MSFWGTLGTTCFFVISGFFSVKYSSVDETRRNAGRHLLDKVIRIWPTYILSILIIFIATHIWCLPGRTVDFMDLVMNIPLCNRFFKMPYVDGAHWYLSVLVTYHVIIYIFECIGVQNKPLPFVLWIFIEFIIDQFFHTGEIYPIGGPFVGCFCIGIALKHIIKMKTAGNTWSVVIILSILTTLINRGKVCALELILIIPLFSLCAYEKIKLFSAKPFVFLGSISYSLYLIHQNISYIIQNRLVDFCGEYKAIYSFAAFVLVLLLGILLYYFVEKPIQNKLDKFK